MFLVCIMRFSINLKNIMYNEHQVCDNKTVLPIYTEEIYNKNNQHKFSYYSKCTRLLFSFFACFLTICVIVDLHGLFLLTDFFCVFPFNWSSL